MTDKEIVAELNHHISVYSFTNERDDIEHLMKILYYAGVLAGKVK